MAEAQDGAAGPSRQARLEMSSAEVVLHLGRLTRWLCADAPHWQQRDDALQALAGALSRLQQLRRGPVHLTLTGRSFCLDWQQVWVAPSARETNQWLARLWTRLGLGRMVFPCPITPRQLEALTEQLQRAVGRPSGSEELFNGQGAIQLHPLVEETRDSGVDAELLLDALLQQGRRSWSRVMAGQRVDLLALRRLLICAIQQLQQGDETLLDLVTAPRLLGLPEAHLAQTALLSLRTGLVLGLPPGRLLELGVAAMLHGLVKVRTATATATAAAGGEAEPVLLTTGDDRAAAARFTRSLLRNLVQTNGLTPRTLPCLLVLHEAQAEFARDDLYPRLGARGRQHSLYGQVIALSAMTSLCDRLDAAGDQAQAGGKALASLMGSLKHINPALVDTFYRSASSLATEPEAGGLQPLDRVTRDDAIPSAPKTAARMPDAALHPDAARILLVDDEPDIRMSLRHLLESFGFRVDEAEDGMWGAQKIRSEQYDLVILDLMMPHMDGFDLLRSLPPARLENLPIVILSARGHDEEILRGYKLGATHYLVKPFDNRTILSAVTQLIRDLAPEQGRLIEQFLSRE